MKTAILAIILSLMVSLFFGGSEIAIAQSAGSTEQAIRTVILDRLQKHGLLKDDNITVTVGDSIVTLSGTVTTLQQKRRAEDDAANVANAFNLVDNLSVRPVMISDQDLYEEVVKQLRHNVFYSIYDWVNLNVKDGKVTLGGWVYEPWHKRQFEHQVERVPGVVSIDNRIEIESGSQFDDGIRFKAAKLIYDNPFYEAYSSLPGAPIHIVVNNGDVTLEGMVSTTFQKNWAKNAIYTSTDAFHVYNHLQIEGK